jgi:pyruvate dehydrogenase E2 component (dihydrolipoamide acetyltransferase)
LGVDWTQLKGSGRTGRIRESDVVAASRSGAAHGGRSLTRAAPTGKQSEPRTSVSVSPAPQSLEPQVLSAVSATPQATVPSAAKPQITPLRRTIAERMLHSQRSTAPVTLNTTVDVSALVQLRRQLKEGSPADEVPSFTDLLIRLTAPALALYPALNSQWDGDEIVTPSEINIGVAVDTEAGLLVPVLRDVATLTLRQITARLRDLALRARRRELKTDEMRGGTFTITNLGSFGIDTFTPIINYPECAVLGVGRIVRQPVVDAADKVVVQDRISLSLTFDHRIVDGAPAARFLQQLSRFLENPLPRLIS